MSLGLRRTDNPVFEIAFKRSRNKIKKVFAKQQRLFRVRYLMSVSQLNFTNSSSRKLFTSTKSSFNLAPDVGKPGAVDEPDARPG